MKLTCVRKWAQGDECSQSTVRGVCAELTIYYAASWPVQMRRQCVYSPAMVAYLGEILGRMIDWGFIQQRAKQAQKHNG